MNRQLPRACVSGPIACAVVLSLGLALLPSAVESQTNFRIEPDRAQVPVGGNLRLRVEPSSGEKAARSVKWSLSGDAPLGRITAEGIYFAPAARTTPATVTVRASVSGDAGGTATATVRIPEVRVSVAPERTQIQMGQSVMLKPRVEQAADERVRYEVEGEDRGRVSAAGVYTPPSSLPTPATVSVHVISVADPTKSATARVDIGSVAVALRPEKAQTSVGGALQFRASVRGTQNDGIIWSVVGENQGTVSESGLYRTPESMVTPARVTVRATSAADPGKYADAQITVTPVKVVVTPTPVQLSRRSRGGLARYVVRGVTRLYLPFDPVSPIVFGPIFRSRRGQLFLPAGGSYQFYARITGTVDDRVRWSVEGDNPVGTISDSGLYVAPERMTTPATVVIRATCVADPSQSALTNLTIPPIIVRAEPKTTQVMAGGTVRLKAEVDNTENDAIEWEVSGPKGAAVGDDGVFTTPATMSTPHSIRVTARSVADPTKSAEIMINVPAVAIALSQESVEVGAGRSHKFTARLQNTLNDEVEWMVDGRGEVGEISPAGVYRAPAGIREIKTVRIVARPAADPSKSAVAVVRIRPER